LTVWVSILILVRQKHDIILFIYYILLFIRIYELLTHAPNANLSLPGSPNANIVKTILQLAFFSLKNEMFGLVDG